MFAGRRAVGTPKRINEQDARWAACCAHADMQRAKMFAGRRAVSAPKRPYLPNFQIESDLIDKPISFLSQLYMTGKDILRDIHKKKHI